MTLRILTCSNTPFIVEAAKYLLRNVSKITTFNKNMLDTMTVHGN